MFGFLRKNKTAGDAYRDYAIENGYIFDPCAGGECGNVHSPRAALAVSVFLACVKVISESVGMLPLTVKQRQDGQTNTRYDHPLSILFSSRINPFQTRQEFVEYIIQRILLEGNFYGHIIRAGGKVERIHPLSGIKPKLNNDWSVSYWRGKEEIPADQMLHIKGFTLNGFEGVSTISFLASTLGRARGQANLASTSVKKGGAVRGVLSPKSRLDAKNAKKLADSFQGMIDNGIAVSPEDVKFQPLAISNRDQQLIESTKLTGVEICQGLRVPPAMVGIMEGTSYKSLTELSQGFLRFTLQPWIKRLEGCFNIDLFSDADRADGYHVDYNTNAFSKTNLKERWEVYHMGLLDSVFTPNEIRQFENMNPISGGDQRLMPLNMQPVATSKARLMKQGFMVKSESEQITERNAVRDEFHRLFLLRAQQVVSAEIKMHRRQEPDIKERLSELINDAFGAVVSEMYDRIEMIVAGKSLGDRKAEITRIYLDELASYWSGLSVAEIDSVDDIEARLSEWEESRARKMADKEIVRADNSLAWGTAVAAAAITGLTAFKKWRAEPGACKFCKKLNGKTLSKGEVFSRGGDSITVNGESLETYKAIKYPGAHRGCKCSVVTIIK